MKAQTYVTQIVCEFAHVTTAFVCTQEVVAVYITVDDRHKARFLCRNHASEAERVGEGPVFWVKENHVR